MSGKCRCRVGAALAAALLATPVSAAWYRNVVGTAPASLTEVVVSSAGAGGKWRVYGIAGTRVSEFDWSGSSWTMREIASVGATATGLAAGPVQSDGKVRLYVSQQGAGPLKGSVFEVAYDAGTESWTSRDLGAAGISAVNDVAVGNGRNDGVLRVYAASSGGATYEYTVSSGGATIVNMGGAGWAAFGITVGAGRSGDPKRYVYIGHAGNASYSAQEWEYSAAGGTWTIRPIGSVADGFVTQEVAVGLGRGQGAGRRVYGLRHNSGTSAWNLLEYTYSGSWSSITVASGLGTAAVGLAIGEAWKTAVSTEVFYAGGTAVSLSSWTGTGWSAEEIFAGTVVQRGLEGDRSTSTVRGDGIRRVYAGQSDGVLAQLRFDGALPVSSVTFPAPGAYAALPTLSGTAQDEVGIKSVSLFVERVNTPAPNDYWSGLTWTPSPTSFPVGGPWGEESAATQTWTYSGVAWVTDRNYNLGIVATDLADQMSSLSGPTILYDTAPPTALTNLAADRDGATEGQVHLVWTAPNDGALGKTYSGLTYVVKYATAAIATQADFNAAITYGQAWTPLSPGTTESRFVSGLTPGTTYYVAIEARDTAGNQATLSNTTGNSTWAQYDVTPPAPVSNLAAAQQAQIFLSWTYPGDDGTAGALASGGYQVRYSSVASDTPDTAPGLLPATTNVSPGVTQTLTVTGLKPRTTYYFWTRVRDERDNWSAWSSTANAVASAFIRGPALGLGGLQEFNGLADPSLAVGDFDDDGDLDAVAIGREGFGLGSARTRVLRNDSGAFVVIQTLASLQHGAAAFGDVDRDGDLDLALAGYTGATRRFIIYRNDGGASPFVPAQEPLGAGLGMSSPALAVGDVDRDGDVDLVVSGDDGANRRLLVYRNDGGTFALAQQPAGANLGVSQGSLALADVDRDGDLDLIVTGSAGLSRRFSVYRNDLAPSGFALWQEPFGASAGFAEGAVAAADADQDGDLDLAVSGTDGTNPRLLYYRNDGSTTAPFALAQEPLGGGAGLRTGGAVAFGDVDNDGAPDLVAAGRDGTNDRLLIFRNGGGAAPFSLQQQPLGAADGIEAGGVVPADADLDGDLDLFVIGFSTAQNGSLARVYTSLETQFGNANSTPTAPPGGFAEIFPDGEAGVLRLQWGNGTDGAFDPDSLSYQARAGSSPGSRQIVSDRYGSPLHGAFIRPRVGTDNALRLVPVEGTTVYWAVRTIDAGLMRSGETAERTFLISSSPAVVTSLSALPGGSEGSVTLTWTAPGDDGTLGTAATYLVRYATVSITPADWSAAWVRDVAPLSPIPAPILGGSPQSLTVTGLAEGVTYYFALRARDELPNESSVSNSPGAPATVVRPAAPTGLTVLDPGLGRRLHLSWAANSEDDLKDYRVWRATYTPVGIGGAFSPAGVIASPGTTHQDAGLADGTTYYYRLTARDTTLHESGGSSEASGTPQDTQAPAAPTGFALTPSTNVINMSWLGNAEDDLKDYRIYRSTNGGVTLVSSHAVTAVLAPGATHQDAGLTNGTTYYYRLTARDGTGNESEPSGEVSSYPRAGADVTPPAAPTGLGAANAGTGGRLNLSWTANAEGDMKDYGIYRATYSGFVVGAAFQAARVVSPGTTHQDTGLTDETTYYVRLTARDSSNNESAGSSEASAIPRDTTAPAAPGALTVSATAGGAAVGGRLSLSWAAVSDEALKDYRVWRATYTPVGIGGAFSPAGVIASPGATHQDTGLTDGATFYYRVTARDVSLNESGASPETSAVPRDTTPPAAPVTLGASDPATGSVLILSWSANTDADLKDYRLYRSTNGGVTLVSSHVVTGILAPGTTHQDAGLTNGTTYAYRLTARDAAGNESGASPEASGRPTDVSVPATPAGLGAANAGPGNRLTLSWTANTEDDLKDYRVWRATYTPVGIGGAFSPAGVIASPGTTHQDGGLTNGTTFYYQITARDTSLNESGGSDEASDSPSDTQPPAAPATLGASDPATGGALNLSWSAVSDEALKDYRVWRATASPVGIGGAFSPAAVILVPGTTHQDAGLVNGTTYYYRVTARDTTENESGGSPEASGRPSDAVAPAAPTGVGASNTGPGNQVNLSWSANTEPDLKDYGVYRATYSGAGATASLRVTFVAAPGTTHQDTGLTDETTYYYRLTARDGSLNEPGGSAEASALPRDTIPPATLTDLAFSTSAAVNDLTLVWTAPGEDGASGLAAAYRIRHATYAVGVDTTAWWNGAVVFLPGFLPASPGNAEIRTVTGLTEDTTYYVAVRAEDQRGNLGGLPAAAAGKTRDQAPPAAVGDLAASSGPVNGTLLLTWTAPGDNGAAGAATDYAVRYATYAVGGSTLAWWNAATPYAQAWLPVASGAAESRTLTGLTPATTYYVALEARDEAGNTAPLSNVPSAAAAAVGIHHFDITGLSTTTTAGSGLGFTLTARTAANAVMTDYTGTATFSTTDPQATLPSDTPFTAGDQGIRTFVVGSLVFRTAGGQTAAARDALLSSASGQSPLVQVSSAAFSQFEVTGLPQDPWAHVGRGISPVVDATDPFGNRITNYAGTIVFDAIPPGAATLPGGTSTFGPQDTGRLVFTNGVTFQPSGVPLTELFVDDVPFTVGFSSRVSVAALSSFKFRVNGLPATLTAGAPASVTVEALTPVGTRYIAYQGTVRFSATDGQAALPPDTALTAEDLGVRTFPNAVVLKTAGTHSVTAEDPASADTLGKMTGTQSGIVVVADAPPGPGGQPAVDHFRVEFLDVNGNVTTTVPADAALEIRVTARDRHGNLVTGFNGTVQIGLSSGRITPSVVTLQAGGPPPGIRTFVRVEAGRETTVTVTVNGTPAKTAAGATLSLSIEITAVAKTSVGYPNPFDPAAGPATIRYYLSDPGEVDIQIFTLTGAQVRRWTFPADRGSQYHLWDGVSDDGAGVASGGYLVHIQKRYGDQTEKEVVNLAILRR